MSEKPYTIKQKESLIFSFTSVGPKGRIEKLVRYESIGNSYFNLGFGDRIGTSLKVDDTSRSDNGDMKIVLSTVIKTIDLFFDKYPEAIVSFKGSTEERTRFYNRIINNYKIQYEGKYFFWGYKENKYEIFKDGESYSFFLISKIEIL